MTDQIEALERLSKLKSDGMLTDEEFAAQKTAILGGTVHDAAEPPVVRAATQQGRYHTWIAVAVALVLVFGGGILFYIHRQDNVLRDASRPAAVSSPQQLSAPASAPAVGNPIAASASEQQSVDFVITDALLAQQQTLDQLNLEAPKVICLGSPIALANTSNRSVGLATTPPEGADGPDDIQTLGIVRPGEVFKYAPKVPVTFNITEVDGGFLVRVKVNKCSK